jgi:hypothetical protein
VARSRGYQAGVAHGELADLATSVDRFLRRYGIETAEGQASGELAARIVDLLRQLRGY